jgi:hypothetical protein
VRCSSEAAPDSRLAAIVELLSCTAAQNSKRAVLMVGACRLASAAEVHGELFSRPHDSSCCWGRDGT